MFVVKMQGICACQQDSKNGEPEDGSTGLLGDLQWIIFLIGQASICG